MSIAWIYATSNEIVSVVTMIGVVTGLSMELLGLTIMAWSNCIGDIVADIAVVKQGFPKMAMAAAIGGPLFSELSGIKNYCKMIPLQIFSSDSDYHSLLQLLKEKKLNF